MTDTWPASSVTGTVATRLGRVAYRESGHGDPLILLHAALHDHHDYDLIAPRLAGRYRIVAVDWPGHGSSEPATGLPATGLTAAGLAGVLADVVTGLRLPPVRIIGNSVGGFAAARLAIDQPDRVAVLVLVDHGGFGPHGPLTRAYCRFMGRPRVVGSVQPAFIGRYMRPITEHDRAITERARARARTVEGRAVVGALWPSFADPEHDLRGQAARISAPTMIVWGRRDAALPLSYARGARRLIPGSTLHVLDTGHVPFASRPDEFLQLVEPFLAGIDARPDAQPGARR